MPGFIQPHGYGRGMFICIEGGEGVGKTTICEMLTELLLADGVKAQAVSDPGTALLSQKVREIVVDASIPCTPLQQTLLYLTARSSLADEVKALRDDGVTVVSGRWGLSTTVYQGICGGVGREFVEDLGRRCISEWPDICILLDADPQVAISRKRDSVGDAAILADRFDSRAIEWHQSLRDAYLAVAADAGYPVVDATKSIDETFDSVLAVCQAFPDFRKLIHDEDSVPALRPTES